ncbi:TIM barrel protein [Croceicoccus sp. BE223]|uniref:sugar phosphate isomerase/epimerase family protein n=1 Tax=Croceicoccus sp. BE223 TaxID=2817716 RepID=UPI00285DBCEB|nr:TIM barrel protein [Croceicoccus sp. BE223]MDR7102399.1 sugar phosphate isomerase/epimerase [Croceicoccus sp. BE223]
MHKLHAANWTHAGDIRPEPGRLASPLAIRDRIEACARAGFAGMGFIFEDVSAALLDHSAADIRSMLSGNGIGQIEIEALTDWFSEDASLCDEALHLADAIGATQIKAIGAFEGDVAPDEMVSGFARTCDRFGELGAKVVIELMKASNLNTLEKGLAVVVGAGRSNGGILIDSMHVVRCGMSLDAIAAMPRGTLLAVELDGVPEGPPDPDFWADMVDHRLQPDQGQFDNALLVRAARLAGFDGPWGVEIVSKAHRALTLDEAVRRSASATRAVLARADAIDAVRPS